MNSSSQLVHHFSFPLTVNLNFNLIVLFNNVMHPLIAYKLICGGEKAEMPDMEADNV